MRLSVMLSVDARCASGGRRHWTSGRSGEEAPGCRLQPRLVSAAVALLKQCGMVELNRAYSCEQDESYSTGPQLK